VAVATVAAENGRHETVVCVGVPPAARSVRSIVSELPLAVSVQSECVLQSVTAGPRSGEHQLQELAVAVPISTYTLVNTYVDITRTTPTIKNAV
jgi:hypothetical protein